ncbi:hypothetical protein N7468_003610 [Penicillium chermesinum]|uniref:Zn(2)-C6 fungal-type domain-containing protein n=1 Tax=Penicillium chermesinum TaxID=63820 RepID=A0A9W9P7H5_9EURO|nr:uncharacterized protein N7468_003610 [Penicillium chermesinum]KAJ5238991.1 hypothetical protein N7468_003610 [Penicillium chermesinum]
MASSKIEIEAVRASIKNTVERLGDALRTINHEKMTFPSPPQIWSNPELAYEEFKAHDALCGFLEKEGFRVTRHAYGLNTSFEAVSGSGGRLINFNAEYDALPGIGHACGHNLIATSSLVGFLALSFALAEFGLPGRVQLLGTPAEENGGGKAKLIDAGAYDGVDISLMAHAGPEKMFPDLGPATGIAGALMNARKNIRCVFSGKSAHAGGNPWEGINALDALVCSYNNVSVLRQQLLPEQRIHCAFIDTPKVANIIPDHTTAFWQVRSPTLQGLNVLLGKVRNCIEAGALATQCQVEIEEEELYTDVRLNDTLCDRYRVHMGGYGREVLKRHDTVLTGSSDIGNVSYVTPTLHAMFGIPTPNNSYPHNPVFAASAGTDEAHQEAVTVGKSLALIGWEMLTDNDITCRRRKVKCGEERPICNRCANLRLDCEWGVPVARGHSSRVRHLKPAPTTRHHDDIEPVSEVSEGDAMDLSPTALIPGLSPVSWTGDGFHLETSQAAAFYPPFPSAAFTMRMSTPLCAPMSTSGLACANSLVLNKHDRKYFEYFPSSSTVYYYMKGWHWSSFSYLYQGPATTNKVIMRMILALSASDMHRQGLVAPSLGHSTADDHGRYHYSQAVKEFRQLLETPRRQVSVDELETIFATIFLMVTYEWQFGTSVRHLQLHLHGVRSLLESHPQLFRLKDVNDVFLAPENEELLPEDRVSSKVSFISEQFLLWMLYIDASFRPMGLTESLYDYVLQSKNPALHPDHLHRCARLWGRCYWAEQYPDQEVLDDIENYRALELLHAGFCMRHRIWKVLINSEVEGDSSESLSREMVSIRDKYSDLFITAKLSGAISSRRTLNTVYMAVCQLYAQIVFHRRVLRAHVPPTAVHRQAVVGIIELVQKQHSSDPRLLRRLYWPILMALIETNDVIHQAWLRERLFDCRDFNSECRWANEVADQVLVLQDAGQGCYADLAELLLQRFHVL